MKQAVEKCAICGCWLYREKGAYGKDSIAGRSHASAHHYVAERFFGRSKRRREHIFLHDPWNLEGESTLFCYDCHEELLHNPVLTKDDVKDFNRLVVLRQLSEAKKPNSKKKLAGRIELFHEVFELGLQRLLEAQERE